MNELDLRGRVVVVTRAAQGIGLAVVERLLASGASVALWDVNGSQLERAAQALESSARTMTAVVDVASASSVNMACDLTLRHFERVDGLVNNAGITGGNGLLWDLEPAVWRQVIEVNLVGSYQTCHALVPHMIQRGYGRIVNVASVAGKEGNPNASHYSASKAGLIGLTKSLGKELASSGVLVNAVTPAAARTPIFDSMTQEHIDFMLSKIPMKRFLEVKEAASMIAWLLTEDCAFSTGAVFDISGGRATY